jgi:hypothetical protein
MLSHFDNEENETREQLTRNHDPSQRLWIGYRLFGARPLRNFAVIPWLLLIPISLSTVSSSSQERCKAPDPMGAALVGPEQRLGEFRVELQSPDYDNTGSVEEHLVFSRVLGLLVSSTLWTRTHGLCRGVITPALFPDLWAYLYLDRPSRNTEADRAACVDALADSLLTDQPTTAAIRRITTEEANIMLKESSDPDGLYTTATNILTKALQRIYETGTIMHTLALVGEERFRTFDENAFFGWLHGQRSANQFTLTRIPICGSNDERQLTDETRKAAESPQSATIPAQEIQVSVHAHGAAAPPALENVVIIGSRTADMNPIREKYCNNRRAPLSGSGADRGLGIGIRCSAENRYGDYWLVLFCDPDDCVSEEASATVARTIASDPELSTFVRRGSGNGEARGPYLVKVEISAVQ